MERLSAGQARRVALAAQGLHRPRPDGVTDRRHLRRVLQQTNALQIDSVNVLTRAHYLPAWSRIGAYSRDALDRMAYRDRELFEYWAMRPRCFQSRCIRCGAGRWNVLSSWSTGGATSGRCCAMHQD